MATKKVNKAKVVNQIQTSEAFKNFETTKFPPFLTGLNGICELFGVSRSTAYKYKVGILKDAITQNGDILLIDTAKALELFGVKEPERFVEAPNLTSAEL